MKAMTDVDIDVADRDDVLKKLPYVDASISRDGTLIKHNTGVYFQEIPCDPFTNISNIDHKDAEHLGYFKLDFLNNSVYENIKDEDHLNRLLEVEPVWSLLEHSDIVEQLFHINKYSDLLRKLKPTSIEELAMVLAVIRPAKAYLRDKNWNIIKERVWEIEEGDNYHFKRSHSIAYSVTIVVQLNLIIEQAGQPTNQPPRRAQ